MLEPCEGRLSRTVLRGLGASNGPWLPDRRQARLFHAQQRLNLATARPRIRAAGENQAVRIIRGERVGKQGRLAVGCSAAVFGPMKQKILLVRRADNGRWSVPGGYMEPGESVTEACAREVLEETGVRVRVGQLVAVYNSPHILLEYPDGNRLQLVVLHFAAQPVGETLRTSEETTEVGYFSRADIERMDMGGFDRQRIDDAFAAQAAAFVRDDFTL